MTLTLTFECALVKYKYVVQFYELRNFIHLDPVTLVLKHDLRIVKFLVSKVQKL